MERDIDKQSERNSLEIEERAIVIGESERKREKVARESERKHVRVMGESEIKREKRDIVSEDRKREKRDSE